MKFLLSLILVFTFLYTFYFLNTKIFIDEVKASPPTIAVTDTPTLMPPTATSTVVPTATPTRTPTPTPIPTYTVSGTVSNTIDGQVYVGISVTLTQGGTILSTNTDNKGKYSFSGLLAGSYTVTIAIPAGKKKTTSDSQSVTVGPNQTVNFGLINIYDISGVSFLDNNGSGKYDAGDSIYPGATVYLSGDADSTITTDASGNYLFKDVDQGSYTVAMDIPDGYKSTNANSLNIMLNSAKVVNFGIVKANIITVGGACNNNTVDIVLVLDRSGSMLDIDSATGVQKMVEAKQAARGFVDLIAKNLPSARIGIVIFSDNDTYPGSSRLLAPLTSLLSSANITYLKNQISAISAIGGTCMECGVVLANRELNAKTRSASQKLVVFLTDGIANETVANFYPTIADAENMTMTQILDGVVKQNIIYDTIGVGTGIDLNEPFLRQIADANLGKYYNNPTEGSLDTIFTDIANKSIATGNIQGFIFEDVNRDGVYDPLFDKPISIPITVELSGSKLAAPITSVTDANGNYVFNGLCTTTYTVTEKAPPGWLLTTGVSSYSLGVVNGTNYVGFDFGFKKGYEITGSIFNDINKNFLREAGDPSYSGAVGVLSSGGSVTVNPDNTYSVTGLPEGSYTVTANFTPSLLPGYQLLEPKPANFFVTVGPACSVLNSKTGGVCDASGSISNLNFSLSNSWPWIQSYGLDMRFDNGFDNALPAATACGGGSYASGVNSSFNTPGILFSGDSSSSFSQGTVSNKNWVVGGLSYPEVYNATSPLRTSTDSLVSLANKAGIPIVSLTNIVGCGNPAVACDLPNNLAKGIYVADGDIKFRQPMTNVFTVGNTYVFVAQNGKIMFDSGSSSIVPSGAVVIYAAGLDVEVVRGVGAGSNICPVPTGQLQGIFSADRSIIIEGNNGDCTLGADQMLNIDGVVIVNADKAGGSFINKRDLCGDNVSYPAMTFTARPDFILNSPGFLSSQQAISSEVSP